jgi:hypothetical protein
VSLELITASFRTITSDSPLPAYHGALRRRGLINVRSHHDKDLTSIDSPCGEK